MTRQAGGPFGRRDEDLDARSPLPLRATGLFLGAWVIGLVFTALVIVPILFATCFPSPPSS